METTAVRRAEIRDASRLPAVERSAAQAFLEHPHLAWVADDSVQTVEQHMKLIESEVAWVAVDRDDAPIAFLNGNSTNGNLHIREVSVHLDHQRKGIGRALMGAAKQWAVENSCSTITLTTFRNIPWNEGFYKSLGFRTLKSSEVTPSLDTIMKDEADSGLPIEQRCAMCLRLT